MIVLSNNQSVNGAAVIFYPEVLDKIGAQLDGDYFILPSSVHEVILVPDRGQFKYQELEEMVRDINANKLKPSDVLSDTVYHYDNSEKKFELSKDFAERADREENGKEEKAKHKKEKEYERYVQSWIQEIRGKPETLMRAIKDAQAAANFMDYKAGLITELEYEKVKGSAVEVRQKDKELER